MKILSRMLAGTLCAATLAIPAAYADTASPTGTWQLSTGESRFEISTCGDGAALCATLTWLRDDARDETNLAYLGSNVLEGATLSGLNQWRGTVNYDGDTYSGRLTMVDADTMRINGCVGIFCRSMELVRI